MSRENFFSFLRKVSGNNQLKDKIKSANSPDQLVKLGKEHGHDFSTKQVEESVAEIKAKPGAFGYLSEAVLEIFSPDHDDYPATGLQPFEGEPNRKKY